MIDQLPFAGGQAPDLHPGRCVNRRHAGAACVRCVAGCPAQVIALAGPVPVLDERACVRCGLCCQICPTDVFVPFLKFEAKLCETVANLPLEPTALVCGAHPAPATTTGAGAAIVQHRRCLAALAPADWLAMSAGGRRPLWVDDSPCAECAIGAGQATVQRTVDAARALLHVAGCPPAILLHSERPPADARPQRKPLFDGAQPAMSRRAFLNRLRPDRQAANVVPEVDDLVPRGAPVTARLPQQVPAGRRRLLATLAVLDGQATGALPTHLASFADVQVDAARCSACGLCARFCPTGALQFDQDAEGFQLSFQVAACVDCGICAAACPEVAVDFGPSVALAAILAGDFMPLTSGTLLPCAGCGLPTAPLPGTSAATCHVCRQGAGVVTSLRDDAGLMADLLGRLPPHADQHR